LGFGPQHTAAKYISICFADARKGNHLLFVFEASLKMNICSWKKGKEKPSWIFRSRIKKIFLFLRGPGDLVGCHAAAALPLAAGTPLWLRCALPLPSSLLTSDRRSDLG
jgi:hypothetical protein